MFFQVEVKENKCRIILNSAGLPFLSLRGRLEVLIQFFCEAFCFGYQYNLSRKHIEDAKFGKLARAESLKVQIGRLEFIELGQALSTDVRTFFLQ